MRAFLAGLLLLTASGCSHWLGDEPQPLALPLPPLPPLAATAPRPGEALTLTSTTSVNTDAFSSSSEPRRRCPDELLPRGASEAALPVRVTDARTDRREILPLALRTALQGPTKEPAELPRYFAELRVERYESPKLFRRLSAPRSEWAPGILRARLMVQDAEARATLCQAEVRFTGDAREAPIRRRLREMTRNSLQQKLLTGTLAQMESALSGISSVLRLRSQTTDQ